MHSNVNLINNAPNVIKVYMFMLIDIVLWQCVTLISTQQHVVISPDKPHPLDIEPLIVTIRVPDMNICQEISTNDCRNLGDQLLKCQQIIFNDPGFSYQQYQGNIAVHGEILTKYQSICEDTQNDYLANEPFDLKND